PLPGTTFYQRVQAQLGQKQNWIDSNDLAMMYRATYVPDFYRALHAFVHAEFRAHRAADRLKRSFTRRGSRGRPASAGLAALAVFYPTSRCNSRCISCDWWRQTGAGDLTLEEIDTVAASLSALGTQLVVFSGGEPLLRPEVFDAARSFRARAITLHLLTSGILLERSAERVVEQFARVCISLDATDEPLYQRIRGVAALRTVERGVARLRQLAPRLPVTARSTLQRENFRQVGALIDHAHRLGLDGISFLPADVSSTAF